MYVQPSLLQVSDQSGYQKLSQKSDEITKIKTND
jgi:hypothetical protein